MLRDRIDAHLAYDAVTFPARRLGILADPGCFSGAVRIFLKWHVLPCRALSVPIYSRPFVLLTIRHAGMGSLRHVYYAGPTIPMKPLRGLHAVVLGQFTAS